MTLTLTLTNWKKGKIEIGSQTGSYNYSRFNSEKWIKIVQVQKVAKLNRENDSVYKAVCKTVAEIKKMQKAAKNQTYATPTQLLEFVKRIGAECKALVTEIDAYASTVDSDVRRQIELEKATMTSKLKEVAKAMSHLIQYNDYQVSVTVYKLCYES